MLRKPIARTGLLGIVLAACVVESGIAQQVQPRRPAVPVDPVTAIIDAFQTHALVGLGEGTHGGEQDLAFRVSLIRDPRFALTVNDIVVEIGNSRYQDVIDRFVSGDDVPFEELRQVWENGPVTNVVPDKPVYEAFFRAVRDVNASLPRERRLRVLLGEPPIDWTTVKTFADVVEWGDQRDPFAADLIRREVLGRGRRALIVYGLMHFQRRNERANYETADWLTGLIERDGATRLFTVWTVGNAHTDLRSLQPDVSSWSTPSLALLRGTTLGAMDFASFFTSDGRLGFRDGKIVPIPRNQWGVLPMEEQFDAVLYLGPPSAMTIAPLALSRCSDERYMKMRLARLELAPGGEVQANQLRRYCAERAVK
jgi:hypothetical protein